MVQQNSTLTAEQAIAKFQTACKAAFLATIEGDQPRVRPVSPAAVDGNVIWIATFAASDKVAQLRTNPAAEVCYMADTHEHLRLRGHCEFVNDADTKRRLWEGYPLMQRYFTTPDHPQYVLLKFVAAEAMTMPAMAIQYEHLDFKGG